MWLVKQWDPWRLSFTWYHPVSLIVVNSEDHAFLNNVDKKSNRKHHLFQACKGIGKLKCALFSLSSRHLSPPRGLSWLSYWKQCFLIFQLLNTAFCFFKSPTAIWCLWQLCLFLCLHLDVSIMRVSTVLFTQCLELSLALNGYSVKICWSFMSSLP